MIAFPGMLVSAAEKAAIPVPDADLLKGPIEAFKDSHSRFFVFCLCQLGRPMLGLGEHWENAKVIGGFTDEQIKTVTLQQLREAGFVGL